MTDLAAHRHFQTVAAELTKAADFVAAAAEMQRRIETLEAARPPRRRKRVALMARPQRRDSVAARRRAEAADADDQIAAYYDGEDI